MPSIRNIAVGLPVRSGHVLVLDGYDDVKRQAFHRAIGGGIEFGETAEAALRREFREELGVHLDGVRLLAVLEDVFEFEGRPGHQIAHVFTASSVELDVIPLDARLAVLDEGSPVHWLPIASRSLPIYPTGVERLLVDLARQ